MNDRLNQLAEILEIAAIEQHLQPNETLFKNHPTPHSPSIQSIQPIGEDGHGEPCPYNLSLLTIADPETDQPAMPYARLESALIQSLVGAWLAVPHPTPSPDTASTTPTLQPIGPTRHPNLDTNPHLGRTLPMDHRFEQH
jgi:hypothetical protein